MLNENIKKYVELQEQLEVLKEQMETLKATITEEMGSETKVETPDGFVAQLVKKETFKYIDETSMITYLKSKGLNQFIIEKVNTTPMNNELKKGMLLTEELKPLYTKTTSYSFSVKKVN